MNDTGGRASAPPRFLIVRLGALGDVVHAIPAAAAIAAQFPDSEIDWLVDPRYVDLLGLVRCVRSVVPVDPRGGIGRLGATIGALRRARYDAVIDLQGLLKSSVLARLAGAARTVGFPRSHLREPVARVFYSHTPDPGPAVHVVHKNLALLTAVGVHDRTVRFPLEIPATAVADEVALRYRAGDGRAGFALVNPGAGWPNKRWPAERFGAAAAGVFARAGLRSVVLWGPGEEALAASVVASSSGAAELAPATSILDICALARRAALMLSGDTGPLHLAAAVGTPVVALFGPTGAERNGPWDPSDVVVTRTDRCQCLYERRCRRVTGAPVSNMEQAAHAADRQPCIEDIGVDEVVAAVERRLSGAH